MSNHNDRHSASSSSSSSNNNKDHHTIPTMVYLEKNSESSLDTNHDDDDNDSHKAHSSSSSFLRKNFGLLCILFAAFQVLTIVLAASAYILWNHDHNGDGNSGIRGSHKEHAFDIEDREDILLLLDNNYNSTSTTNTSAMNPIFPLHHEDNIFNISTTNKTSGKKGGPRPP